MTDQQLRIKMLREVALRADGFYDRAEKLGQKAAKALTDRKSSQIKNLEGIANSALKTSDIFDFIKTRTARDGRQSNAERKRGWHQENLGPDLLKYLSQGLSIQRRNICGQLNIDTEGIDGLEVHLMLIREFVRQLAAHYEYVCWENKGA
jgi:hypothetical protein